MRIVRSAADLRAAVGPWRKTGHETAFVPTMGALHQGHLALVRTARAHADRVVASIFVNPRQFAEGEDFDRYPRREDEDAAMLAEAGADLLFTPGVDDIYPQGFATIVRVPTLSAKLEGTHRPGHFEGVATVVARLLGLVQPEVALFGEKDWQQLVIVRRMVSDLALPPKIVGLPTVREADGLALSSRNAYLSEAERAVAPVLYRTLTAAVENLATGADVAAVLASARAELTSAGFQVDYVEFVAADSLEPTGGAPGRLLAAAWLGRTRLIDNLAVE